MQTTANLPHRIKDKPDNTDHSVHQVTAYTVIGVILLIILALLFIFPLYWILTGSFKTQQAVNSAVPVWFPTGETVTMRNYNELFNRPAVTWLANTVLICAAAMGLTCISASMGGYALAAFLKLHNTLWAVILPTVGWPFGVFLMKQFSENIPGELLEAARIDGAGEARTFIEIVIPLIKPGIGALAIFTFITAWNDYFLQLIMLNDTKVLTISLGIAKLQTELSTDFGLIMAGAALGSVPIIIIFLIFQKFFTRGITMGAVKG